MITDALIRFLPLFSNAAILCGLIYFVWRIINRRTKKNDEKFHQILQQNAEMKEALDKLLTDKDAEVKK